MQISIYDSHTQMINGSSNSSKIVKLYNTSHYLEYHLPIQTADNCDYLILIISLYVQTDSKRYRKNERSVVISY